MAKKESADNMDSIIDGLMKAVDLKAVNLQRGTYVDNTLTSGSLALDLILGGGWPGGRWSVGFGPESSGKSTLSFFAMAAAVAAGVPVFHFDAEGAADPSYMKRIGLKVDWAKEASRGEQVLYRYIQPDYGEQVFRFIKRYMETLPDSDPGDKNRKIQAMFAIDSLPFLQPQRRFEKDDSSPMAQQARMYSENIGMIKAPLAAKNCVLYAVNQIRMKPGVSYGDPTYEPCLHAHTSIRFADGRVFTIKEIVDQHIEGEVMAHVDGKLEPRRIIGWKDNGPSSPEDWVTIETEGPGSGCGFYRLTATKNHKVLTQRGWVAAGELVPDDDMLHTSYERRFNPGTTAEKFLLGTLLGDCCIPKVGLDRGILKFQDNNNQAYVDWKIAKLSPIVSFSTYSLGRKTVAGADMVCSVSDVRQEFDVLKDQLGNRDPTKVADRLTDLSLAVWYMDDGHYDSANGHNRGSINAKRFSKDENKLNAISTVLKNLGFDNTVSYVDGGFHFSAESFRSLSSTIAKYVPPCMQYKLRPEDRGKYQDFSLSGGKPEHIALPVAIRDIQYSLSSRRARYLGRYDLEVEGAHNYQAGSSRGGLVVHNCGETPKHASDLRLKMSRRSVPSGKGGPIEEEPCWDGRGTDKYIYTIVRTIKNKMFSPFRETWLRIWFEEKGMPGRGIDPFYDVYQYLTMTAQLVEKRGFFEILLSGYTGPERITWQQFKALVLDPKFQLDPGTNLRALCRAQFPTGEAFKLYFSAAGGQVGASGQVVEGEEGEEDAKPTKEAVSKAESESTELEAALPVQSKKRGRPKVNAAPTAPVATSLDGTESEQEGAPAETNVAIFEDAEA